MSVALNRIMSRERFLEWEERQELRYEFDGVRVRAMTGGTLAHALIQSNLVTALNTGLRGTPCRAVGSELKIATAEGFRYPDALVFCTMTPPGTKVITDPAVVFEIVSPSSVTVDFVTKNAEYRAIPSVRRYVVLQQTGAAAAVFSRKGEDWVSELVAGEGAVLRMPEIGLEVALAEIYRDVELQAEASVAGGGESEAAGR